MFASSRDSVFRAVEMAVEWGRAHADYTGVQAVGIDEAAWQRGYRWCTQTMRSTIEPMKKVARMLCAHRDLPMN